MNPILTFDLLLEELASKDIKISVVEQSLKIQAKPGVVDAKLQVAIKEHKPRLLESLGQANDVASEGQPQSIVDKTKRSEPFGFSDLQKGFIAAADEYMEFNVRPHYYFEKTIDSLIIERFKESINNTVLRHAGEMVEVVGIEKLQVRDSLPDIPISVYDFSGIPTVEVEAKLLEVREGMSRKEFGFNDWPWIELAISCYEDENGIAKQRIHLNNNNFLSDGVGLTVFWSDVWYAYKNPTASVAPLELTLRDAHQTLDSLSHSAKGLRDRQYWQDRLQSLPYPPDIPLRGDVPRRKRSNMSRRFGVLKPGQWEQLKAIARSAGVSPSSAVFTAYLEVIATWSGSDHFIVSNMVTRRFPFHKDIWNLIGNFASLYPLEVDFRNAKTFIQKAQAIQTQIIKDTDHLYHGGVDVMRALGAERCELGVAPVPFVVGSGLHMKGFEAAEYSLLETCQVLLDCQFWELGDGSFYYVWDVLEEYFVTENLDAMQSAFEQLIVNFLQSERNWHSDERQVLVPEAQLACRGKPTNEQFLNVTRRLEDNLFDPGWLSRYAENTAIIAGESNSLSFEQLNLLSTQYVNKLFDMGVSRGDKVVVNCPKSIEVQAIIMAILRLGAVYVPIDPSAPTARKKTIVEKCSASVIFSEDMSVQNISATTISTDRQSVGEDSAAFDAKSNLAVKLDEESDGFCSEESSYIIFTSGTTGEPKGVELDHQGPLNTILDINNRFNVDVDDTILGVSSLGFDLSIYDIFAPLQTGASLVFPEHTRALDPMHWIELAAKHGVTVWNSAPALAMLLCDALILRCEQLTQMRLIMISGDWVPTELPEALQQVCPNAEIVSLGGATEASIWSIIYPIKTPLSSWSSIPYGLPMENQFWKVLDSNGRECPDWVTGDLYIGGVGLAKGYLNDEQLTSSKFIESAFGSQQRLYSTGDLGRYRDNGLIEFMGRSDDQVKLAGHRIELGEIEQVLKKIEVIQAAAVLPVTDAGGKIIGLAACVSLAEGKTMLESAMREFLADYLPKYMVPKRFVYLEEFPLTANGKVDRKHLEKQLRSHADIGEVVTIEHIAPRSKEEILLAKLWSELLGVPTEKLSCNDNFFELGGRSIQAIQLISRINSKHEIELSLVDVVNHANLGCLAERLVNLAHRNDSENTSCLVRLNDVHDGIPLVFLHPGGGNVLCYKDIAQIISNPVFGCQFGFDVATLPSVEMMAEEYAKKILLKVKTDTVYIGGWSSGGLIAYATGLKLAQYGIDVKKLYVIDTPSPGHFQDVDLPTYKEWFIGDLEASENVRAQMLESDEASSPETILWAEELSHALKADGNMLGEDAKYLNVLFLDFHSIVKSTRNYKPTIAKASFPAVVFRAANQIVSEYENHPYNDQPDWGWSAMVSEVTMTERLYGNHYEIMRGSSAYHIARKIADDINDDVLSDAQVIGGKYIQNPEVKSRLEIS